jgi:diamine N-acetyltransferase
MFTKGEKIFLRALEPSDADVLYNWENDSENWHVSNVITPFSKSILRQFVEGIQDIYTNKQLRLMICLNSNGEPVGSVDLFDFEPFHLRAGIGIIIAEKDQRQKGLASEALDLLTEYCFSVLLLHQLYCNIEANNLLSVELFKSRGFEVVGNKKQWNRSSDGYKDELLLQLIRKS